MSPSRYHRFAPVPRCLLKRCQRSRRVPSTPCQGRSPNRRLCLSPCARISLSARSGLPGPGAHALLSKSPLPPLPARSHPGRGSAAPPFSLKRPLDARARSRIAIFWCCAPPPLTMWLGAFWAAGFRSRSHTPQYDHHARLPDLRSGTRSSYSAGLLGAGGYRLSCSPTHLACARWCRLADTSRESSCDYAHE